MIDPCRLTGPFRLFSMVGLSNLSFGRIRCSCPLPEPRFYGLTPTCFVRMGEERLYGGGRVECQANPLFGCARFKPNRQLSGTDVFYIYTNIKNRRSGPAEE